MKTPSVIRELIVYESVYGNTHAVAEAIGEGLRGAVDAEVIRAADIQGHGLDQVALVVAGGPTHGHGLSRPQLREAGVRGARDAGAEVDRASEGPWLREWLESVDRGSGWAAAFDTRYDFLPELLTGHAGKGIMRRLEGSGFRRLSGPESFLVSRENRLLPGETDRARAWGVTLGQELLRCIRADSPRGD